MKILVATPLYPPDIAEPAPYVKELVRRLQGVAEVTVLAYNHIPEDAPGVSIITVPKRSLLPIRIARYTYTLWRESRKADLLYVQNGPSTELPLVLVKLVSKIPCVLQLGDEKALSYALGHSFRKNLLSLALTFSDKIVTHSKEHPRFSVTPKKVVFTERPAGRPEILPFVPKPESALEAYESSWRAHVRELSDIFKTLSL